MARPGGRASEGCKEGLDWVPRRATNTYSVLRLEAHHHSYEALVTYLRQAEWPHPPTGVADAFKVSFHTPRREWDASVQLRPDPGPGLTVTVALTPTR